MYLLPTFLYRKNDDKCTSWVVFFIFFVMISGIYFGIYYKYRFNGFVGFTVINATRFGMNDYGTIILFAVIGLVIAIMVMVCVVLCQCKRDGGSVWIMVRERYFL